MRSTGYLHIFDSLRFSWCSRRLRPVRPVLLLLLILLSLLYGAAACNMAAFVIFVLSPLLAALLPANLRGQFGERSVDVVRGVTVVWKEVTVFKGFV